MATTKAAKAKTPGKPDRPKDPAKSKKVPPEKVTEIRQKSNGKYKNDKAITDILDTIDCTEEPPGRLLKDRGIRV